MTRPDPFTPNHERLKDGLSIAALWLLLLLLLSKALLPAWVLLPLDIVNQTIPPWQQPNQTADVHNPLLEDAVFYIYPVKAWTAAQVRQGELPLWSPELFGGYPASYDTQAGLFYPLSLLYYGLDGATAVDLTIFLQMGLGATFMFLYLRRLRLRRLAAIFGAVVFMGNGLMVVWLEWQVVHAAIIWLPLALWAVEKQVAVARQPNFVARQTTMPMLLFALAFALPWLGGHWNWALYVSITAVLYLFWRMIPIVRQSPRLAWRLMGLPLLLGIGLSLIQVLPAFRFLLQSHRQPLTWAESQQYGLLNRFAVLVMPDFFGTPLAGNWWGFDNYNETALYVGILPLLLVGAAVWLARGRRVTQFWLGWGGLGLLWTLGTPAYGLLYMLPVFNGLLPSRAAVLVVLSAAVLSAIGLDRLMAETAVRRRGGWLAGSVAVLLALAFGYLFWYRGQVAWQFWERPFFIFITFLVSSSVLLWLLLCGAVRASWLGGLALLLLIMDLGIAGYGYNTVSPVSELFVETETAVFLHSLPTPPRITSLAEGIAYRPNTALAEGVPSLSGYGPGIAQKLVDYLRLAEGGEVIRFGRVLLPLQAATSPLIDALGVSHIVTTQDIWGDMVVPAGKADVADWRALAGVAQRPLSVGQAGLFRIDLPVRVAPSAQGNITLRLFTADGAQELANHSVSVTDADSDGWISFFFAPFPPEWGNEFVAALHFDGNGEVTVGQDVTGDWAYAAFVRPRPGLVYESGRTRVYANEGDLGRAFVVAAAQVAESPEAALAAVQANGVQLNQVVVLEVDGQPEPPPIVAPAATVGSVTMTDTSLNRVAMQAEMTAPGFVVLADAYYPGWQATVDEQSTPIYRANTVVRAVYVPAGSHEIVFRYRPVEFWVGAAVSGLTLVVVMILGGLGMWFMWRKRP